ncbi:MAG: hypothetical protein OXE86_05375 [Alphaproteobacteria bacterium]|nr:hypothetical protein [Alphaproteobacteria bacterium]
MSWSVGISVSPCEDAAKIGYDDRQINRIVIRMAQYFLDHDMRVIFGHDWREDGVMQAVADFAAVVAARTAVDIEEQQEEEQRHEYVGIGKYRMVNLVATPAEALSPAAVEAREESKEFLAVLSVDEIRDSAGWQRNLGTKSVEIDWVRGLQVPEGRAGKLTALRAWITALLAPGCRICLGGKMRGYQGSEPGVIEEAGLALKRRKPLYLLGGLGGATKAFIESKKYAEKYESDRYWKSKNGLDRNAKKELFDTVDPEVALRLIAKGISTCIQSSHSG